MKKVVIHTDGGARGNPGPGGFGAILSFGPHRKEVKGAFYAAQAVLLPKSHNVPFGFAMDPKQLSSGKDISAASMEIVFKTLTDLGVRMQKGGSPGVRLTEPEKFAVNLQQTGCPACDAPLPRARMPKNMRQFWWGGWLMFKYPDSFAFNDFLISMFSLLFSLFALGAAAWS